MGFSGLFFSCARAERACRTNGMTVSSKYARMGSVSNLFLADYVSAYVYLTHFVTTTIIYSHLNSYAHYFIPI